MSKNLPGFIFLLVGNSGSGKDSIISGVMSKYPSSLKKLYSPKRYITRPPSEFEENISLIHEEFKDMQKKGSFALEWHIYGLNYGVSVEIEEWLKNGHPVIINVSRIIVEKAREKYKNIRVIFVEVPLDITIKRLKNRKRETDELLKERIDRARKNQKFPEADFIVDNSGDLDFAINQCLNYLESVIKTTKV
ncbi:hypothetical protein LCGC14_0882970 [marine sediment metagenome]|uniref:Guanylate kinase-like domain-containing protein n=1 Tax=marine sediment metagenome TaxID=412755 RepID=A0A0F9P198_9ZZZZ|nr:MAG: Ribose 1,5-bisphosphate phosphokinase PhnN [Candidatus Lokiarchaeum sp. GC14_75]